MNIPDILPDGDYLDELTPEELGLIIIFEIEKSQTPNTLNVIQACIDAGADLNVRYGDYDHTPLFSAATYGRLNALNLLIAAGATMDVKNSSGWTPLHFAARFGLLEVMNALITAGAALELRDSYGRIALHWAAIRNRPEAVKALINAGASIDAKDNQGRTPWDIATENIKEKCPELKP